MAISAMICGIIGLLGLIVSGIRLIIIIIGVIGISEIGNNIFSLIYIGLNHDSIITYISIFFISFILLILAFIFGIIERKKGRGNLYGMATSGFILGLIGIIITILPISSFLGIRNIVISRIEINNNRLIAEQEFYDIANLVSATGVFNFMDETYMEIIQNALNQTRTLEGIIISGPSGEFGFEKERGSAIVWVNNSPKFKKNRNLSNDIYFSPLRIPGLRNVNIQAIARKK